MRGMRENVWLNLRRYEEMQFTVTLNKDEDGYIVASCPALPGCHTQGKTEEEALANVKEAILACLLTLNDRARRHTLKQGEKRVG
jgi:predicted RNase H-like HicB family nuclease